MITFLDGPAEGKQLSLSRAPYFLRVVIDLVGAVDALDQLDDTVRPGETAYVYQQAEIIASAIVCSRGRGCRHEYTATYRLYAEQPPQELLADSKAWGEWAHRTYGQAGHPHGAMDPGGADHEG